MAFEIGDALDVIHSHCADLGQFKATQIGEYIDPPDSKIMSAAIFVDRMYIADTQLNSHTEVHTVIVRAYMDFKYEPRADMEKLLAAAGAHLLKNLGNDFSLAGKIRNIDIGGQFGERLNLQYGQVTIAQTIFKGWDMTVPMIVDSDETHTP